MSSMILGALDINYPVGAVAGILTPLTRSALALCLLSSASLLTPLRVANYRLTARHARLLARVFIHQCLVTLPSPSFCIRESKLVPRVLLSQIPFKINSYKIFSSSLKCYWPLRCNIKFSCTIAKIMGLDPRNIHKLVRCSHVVVIVLCALM